MRQLARTTRRPRRSLPLRLVRFEARDLPSSSIPLSSSAWTAIGPAPIGTSGTDSGRIAALAADPGNSNVVYIASAGGGVWKTSTATAANPSWSTTTDSMSTLVSGAIAIAPSNTNIVYWGTGEGNSAGDSQYGRGVFKSTNAGASWSLVSGGTFDRNCIEKIVVDPSDPNRLFLAAGGFAAGNASGNFTTNVGGVWRSMDGGATWTNTTTGIAGSTSQAFMDLEMIPGSPNTLYTVIGTYYGSSINGVYVTTNGGTSWSLVGALPSGSTVGRGELAVTAANSSVIVYSVANTSAGGYSLFNMYRTTNSGASWSTLSLGANANYLGGQGWYDQTLAVSPTNASVIYAGGQTKVVFSTDSGVTWTNIAALAGGPHADHHGTGFDAAGRFLDGNDGGIWRFDAGTSTWSNLNGAASGPATSTALNTNQAVSIGLHPTSADIVYAGLQDNGTIKFNDNIAWSNVRGGDGGFTRVDSTNGQVVYHEYFGLSLEKSIDGGVNWSSATSGITSASGGNFYRPYEIDPGNHNRLFYGTTVLWVSTNGASSWSQLGSYSDPNSIDAIGVGPASANIIYLTNGPSVFVSTNGGASFSNLTPAGGGSFSDFAVDPTDSNICVVTAKQFGASHVWRTTNAGTSWTDITGNLPNSPVGTVVLDPGASAGTGDDVLYVGTDDQGVWSSINLGGTWSKFGTGLPSVQIRELQFNSALGIVAVGTYGRGVWEIKSAAATFTVTNTNDSGVGSLRQAFIDANAFAGTQTITFDSTKGTNFNLPQTITLTTGSIAITDAVEIDAPGSGLLTVSGNNLSRIFTVDKSGSSGNSIVINGMRITSGKIAGARGGAVLNQDEALSMTDVIIENSTSDVDGGGISVEVAAGSLSMTNCIVRNNTETGAGGDGGGINLQGASALTLNTCTVSGNSSADDGAGIYFFSGGTLMMTNSTVSGNKATGGDGGGLYLYNAKATIINSTFSGNFAGGGGGGIVLFNVSTATLQNSTVAFNSSTGAGGGIDVASGTLSAESSIIAKNTHAGSPNVAGAITENFGLIDDATGASTSGANNVNGVDPQLAALALNGGFTQTHALASTSPAINKGSNPTSQTFDQRGPGYPRMINSVADIGAVEFIPASFIVINTNDAGPGSLREAVIESSATAGFQSITFDTAGVFATPQTIHLTSGQLPVMDATNIIGTGSANLTVDAGALSRVFFVDATGSGNSVTISGMTISGGLDDKGGGIYDEDEALTLNGVVVQYNAANETGGGIDLNDDLASLSMTNCQVLNNKVSSGTGLQAGDGGGIFILGNSVATLNSCTVSGNFANDDGGGIYFYLFGTLNLNSSTVSGNKTNVDDGGGIYLFATAANILNSTISGNSAGDGGGGIVAFSGSTAKIQNSTIAFNTAAAANSGGGIWNSSSTLTIESTIVAKNTDTGAPDIGGSVTTTFSLISDLTGTTTSGGGNFFGFDPLLGPLANNGGPTQTHALLAGSVAINHGSNPAAQAFDQRGVGYPRTLNGVADIGAVEFTPTALVVRNTNDSGADSLRQCIIDSNGMVGTQNISFDPTVFNAAKTITLTSGELLVTDSTSVFGPGAPLVNVSGNNASRVFDLNGPGTLSITLAGMTISGGNSSSGAGVFSAGENLTLQSCVITGNKGSFAPGISAYSGGAFIMNDCQVTNNVATSNVGGISATGGATIARSTISGNSATGTTGGLYVNGYTLLTDSTVSGNSAGSNGAGIFFDGAVAFTRIIRNSTVSGNTAGGAAGGIALGFNTTYTFLGSLVVQNSTITNNKAQGGAGGGGIARLYGTGSISLESTVVSGNLDTSGKARPDLYTTGTVTANVSAVGSKNGVTTFTADATTTALLGAALNLGPLADNGGPTLTHLPAAGSVLINKGSNPAGLAADQRGSLRVVGGQADIGSVETSPQFIVVNANDHGQGSLRQCILDANAAPGTQNITFDATFFATPRVITLTTGELLINDSVNVTGPGNAQVKVSGNNASRVFEVNGPGTLAVTLSGMTISGGSAVSGGGVYSAGEKLTLQQCIITGNSAGFGGGVTSGNRGLLTLTDSQVTNNTATNNVGGIDAIGGVTILRSTISGNTAAGVSGGIYANTSFTMTESTVSGNSAGGGGGGGVFLDGAAPFNATILNSTISGNTASTAGGGVALGFSVGYPFLGTLFVQNSTITNNTSKGGAGGGGIARLYGTGSISVESTIVSGNFDTSGNARPDFFTTGTVTAKFSAIGSKAGVTTFTPDATTTALLGAALNLGPLADNGGPTFTHLPGPGSVLINKGSNPAGAATDQRGSFRVIGGQTDVGSVETSPQFFVVNTLDHGAGSLRQCVLDANATPGLQNITFDTTIFASPQVINLTTGEIDISETVNIFDSTVNATVNNAVAGNRVFNTAPAPTSTAIGITGLTISGGTGVFSGGGIFVGDEALTLTNCTVTGNSASRGGGVYMIDPAGSLTFKSCTVSNNTANNTGAGINLWNGGSLLLDSSTVSGNNNTGSNGGGGLYFWGPVGAGGILIRNSTIANNTSASSGGGIFINNFSGLFTIQNSTIVGNTVTAGSGGGIANNSGGTVSIESCIVSGNNNAAAPDIAAGGTVNVKTSAIGSGTGFTKTDLGGNLAFQPFANLKLGPLANNGGPTQTMALLTGSPCINVGSNPAPAAANDQRGFLRVAGPAADMGAFEVQPPPTVTLQVNDGSAQRSMVTRLVVTFSGPPVSFPSGLAAAFQLNRTGPGAPIGSVNLNFVQVGNVITITFAAGGVVGIDPANSLIDGAYQLTIFATKVLGENAQQLDGDGNGTGGDNYQSPFSGPGRIHRLFGDSDGNGSVDVLDFGQFRGAFGTTNFTFDYDGGGSVDVLDFGQFRGRFGTSV